jgi:hypothetical protein
VFDSARRQLFRLISFGGDIVGSLNGRLQGEFTRQNSQGHFLDVLAPAAVKQIMRRSKGRISQCSRSPTFCSRR